MTSTAQPQQATYHIHSEQPTAPDALFIVRETEGNQELGVFTGPVAPGGTLYFENRCQEHVELWVFHDVSLDPEKVEIPPNEESKAFPLTLGGKTRKDIRFLVMENQQEASLVDSPFRKVEVNAYGAKEAWFAIEEGMCGPVCKSIQPCKVNSQSGQYSFQIEFQTQPPGLPATITIYASDDRTDKTKAALRLGPDNPSGRFVLDGQLDREKKETARFLVEVETGGDAQEVLAPRSSFICSATPEIASKQAEIIIDP